MIIISSLFISHKIFKQTILIASFIFGFFQQWRLIPKLAATYALAYFARTFQMNFVQLQIGMMMGETGKAQVSVWKVDVNLSILIGSSLVCIFPHKPFLWKCSSAMSKINKRMAWVPHSKLLTNLACLRVWWAILALGRFCAGLTALGLYCHNLKGPQANLLSCMAELKGSLYHYLFPQFNVAFLFCL